MIAIKREKNDGREEDEIEKKTWLAMLATIWGCMELTEFRIIIHA